MPGPPVRRRCAVLGSPIAHSRSPQLWRAAFRELRLDWVYDAVECSAEQLPGLLEEMSASGEWAAVSLTMPLKLAAVPLVDTLDAQAAAVGAVNTVVFSGESRRGLNTDVAGLVACLGEAGVALDDRAAPLVLGGGGTARAAIAALGQAGAEVVRVSVREPARAMPLLVVGSRSGAEVRLEGWPERSIRYADAPVVVQTTPAGAADPLACGGWPAGTALVEALYDPWPTPLAAAASAAGAVVVPGLRLLAHQAAAAIRQVTSAAVTADQLVQL